MLSFLLENQYVQVVLGAIAVGVAWYIYVRRKKARELVAKLEAASACEKGGECKVVAKPEDDWANVVKAIRFLKKEWSGDSTSTNNKFGVDASTFSQFMMEIGKKAEAPADSEKRVETVVDGAEEENSSIVKEEEVVPEVKPVTKPKRKYARRVKKKVDLATGDDD
jgi:hypothetical protein